MGDYISDRLRVSLKADYALKAIFDLARQRPGEPVRIADIAKRQKIPQKFLESILSGLKQGGFVESRRGVEGGYLLVRSPEVITVGEVLRFVEGTRAGRQRGMRERADPFSDVWRQVDAAVSAVVDHKTFAELIRTWQERQDKYVASWEI